MAMEMVCFFILLLSLALPYSSPHSAQYYPRPNLFFRFVPHDPVGMISLFTSEEDQFIDIFLFFYILYF